MLPVGALVGATCGLAIGVVCGGAAPINILDMLALARTPTAKLRHLLDPEDLVRIASLVRSRTTQVFHTMFDPAERPPEDPQPPPKADDAWRDPIGRDGASDARARAARVARCLWNLPYGGIALYPFKLLATWLHEMSHGARHARSPARGSSTC